MMQDSRGFLWIGTWDGLNRYDGYDFVVYNTANGLSHPTVNCILEDDNTIWIGTDDGLNILNRVTGRIEVFRHNPDNPNTISDNFINCLFEDKDGYIWICTANGLNRYNKNQRVFTALNFYGRVADSLYSNFITGIRQDHRGRLWIATHNGIHCMDPATAGFEEFKLGTGNIPTEIFKSNYVEDLDIDDDGQVYTATLNGVYLINPGYGVVHHLAADGLPGRSLSSNQVNVVMVDNKGLVWIGTNNGLDIYDPVNNNLSGIKPGTTGNSLSNGDVRSLYQDQAGTIWVGTYKGLNKVNRSQSRFPLYQNDPDDPNSLSDNIIYSITEDDQGRTWIGTYGGVNIFDRKNDLFSFIRHSDKDPGSLSSDKIRTMVIDSAGIAWIGTESSGINRLDIKSGQISHIYHNDQDSGSISEDYIISMMVDSKGKIWVGTVGSGINILNSSGKVIEKLSANNKSRIRLPDNKIWAVYEDRQGNFWIGTNAGLLKLSPGLNQLLLLSHDQDNSNSLSSNRVFSILQDRDGIFWIGTMGGGLNRYDPNTGQFKLYDEEDGLPNNVVYTALEDGKGNLWITTNGGIAKFSKQTETFVIYDSKDGVQGNEFNANAYFQNKKGEIFFGGMNGLNIFHPDDITLNMLPPRIVFTGLRVLNDLTKTELDDGEVIRLDYTENFFAIEFSSLDYTKPLKNLYRYKLDNYDDDWIFANALRRHAEYRKVEPGTYRFSVTGSNNDGVWNDKGISLTIIIRPPWWRTWIFKLSMGILIITIAYIIVISRLKSLRRKHDVEKKMLTIEKQVFELEQKALRLQMNPHFIFNSLNAIQNFVLANDTDRAVNYLAKFSHLMRMILANSTASLITLKDEMKALTYYIDLEKLRFDDKFDYIIEQDPALDEEFVEIPPMLFQPYVENAIIHGLVNSSRKGQLLIRLRLVNAGTLLCTIKDNGIGREKAIEIRNRSGIRRQPKGMSITQERIEIFNKQNKKNYAVRITDLKDDTGEPAGTMVELTIQFKEA